METNALNHRNLLLWPWNLGSSDEFSTPWTSLNQFWILGLMPPRFFSAKDSRAREAAVATHPCGQAAGQWKAGQDEVEGQGPCIGWWKLWQLWYDGDEQWWNYDHWLWWARGLEKLMMVLKSLVWSCDSCVLLKALQKPRGCRRRVNFMVTFYGDGHGSGSPPFPLETKCSCTGGHSDFQQEDHRRWAWTFTAALAARKHQLSLSCWTHIEVILWQSRMVFSCEDCEACPLISIYFEHCCIILDQNWYNIW